MRDSAVTLLRRSPCVQAGFGGPALSTPLSEYLPSIYICTCLPTALDLLHLGSPLESLGSFKNTDVCGLLPKTDLLVLRSGLSTSVYEFCLFYSFAEVWLIHSKLYVSKVHTSVNFNLHICLLNHHYDQDNEGIDDP